MKRKLLIFDTTLRDGEQAPGCTMQIREKIAVAKLLEKLNVDVIEVGFAAASQGDFSAIQAVSRAVKKPVVSSLCRALQGDIDLAAAALSRAKRPRLHVFLATSDIHLKAKLKMTRAQAWETAVSAVKYAAKLCRDVQFTAEDAGRTDPRFLVKVINAAIMAGATTVNLSDTVGYLMPDEFGALVAYVRGRACSAKALLSVHVHNDLGLALASTLAAVQAGADQVECTINGIGDRAGICALDKLIAALKVRQDCFPGIFTDVREEFLLPAGRLVKLTINF